VLIVGGGPVGLATAIACRRRGLDVTLLESRSPPIDKACGEGILPEGVELLRRSGVSLEGAGEPLAGIAWHDERSAVAGRFPRAPGLGVRRTTLHERLMARADELGANLRFGVRVRELNRSAAGFGVRATDGLHEPRWLVAADGLASPLRRAAGLDGTPARRRRLAVRRHFLAGRSAAAADGSHACFVEVHWGDRAEAYVTPLGRGELGVAMLWHDHVGARAEGGARAGGGARFAQLLARFPDLAARLEGAAIRSADRGAGPLRQRARAPYRNNLALVGDAAGYLDAITGEGLSLGFQQAEALADTLAAGDLRRYARVLPSLRRLPDALTELCLLLSRHPALRARTLAALAREPRLFERLLAVHVRAAPARAPLAAKLLWRVATAR
jgi:menaquinone-9 beta-reductase